MFLLYVKMENGKIKNEKKDKNLYGKELVTNNHKSFVASSFALKLHMHSIRGLNNITTGEPI